MFMGVKLYIRNRVQMNADKNMCIAIFCNINSMTKLNIAIITSCQEAEKNRQAEAQSHQIPQPTNPEAGDSQVQAEPAQEQEKKSKAKAVEYSEFTIIERKQYKLFAY